MSRTVKRWKKTRAAYRDQVNENKKEEKETLVPMKKRNTHGVKIILLLERGEDIRFNSLVRLSKALGVSLEELVKGVIKYKLKDE